MSEKNLVQITVDLGDRVWWLIPTSFENPDALWEALSTVGQDKPRRRGNTIFATMADLDRAEAWLDRKREETENGD